MQNEVGADYAKPYLSKIGQTTFKRPYKEKFKKYIDPDIRLEFDKRHIK